MGNAKVGKSIQRLSPKQWSGSAEEPQAARFGRRLQSVRGWGGRPQQRGDRKDAIEPFLAMDAATALLAGWPPFFVSQ
jgi:hypothetical protein